MARLIGPNQLNTALDRLQNEFWRKTTAVLTVDTKMSVLLKRGGNLICFWGNKGNGGEHRRAGTGFPNPFLMNGKKQKTQDENSR